MESLQIDDRVMVRSELVRLKQERKAHEEAGAELDLQSGRAIQKARDLGVPMEEASQLLGFKHRTTPYNLLRKAEEHERQERVA